MRHSKKQERFFTVSYSLRIPLRSACGLLALLLVLLGRPVLADDTPYYGGFGAGFLHINADGTYGKGEIRSGDLGLKFYGPTFGGPYNFKMYTRQGAQEWTGDLVVGKTPGLRVEYLPLFPKCQYRFQYDALPLDVKMEAFAPWIPGDSRMTSLPVLFFDFQLTNTDPVEKTAALTFMIPNPDCGAGTPIMDNEGRLSGVLLQSERAGGGTLCGMVRNDGDARNTCGGAFDKGTLSGTVENLLASSITVPANATRHIVFVLAWDFPVYVSGDGQQWPRKELGHYHNNFYQGADAIARDCCDNYPSIHAGVDAWFRSMWEDSSLPQWMRQQILINTSHMAYNGVFFKNGHAAMKEGDDFQLVATYDEQFFSSLPELMFLPEAEWGNLQIFAEATTPEGAIRHDLGDMCVTATGTSPDHAAAYPGGRSGFWNAGDNTPEWMLDLYRDYLWTGEIARMKALWPTVEKGCAYMLAGDADNNGLYDDGKTYDCFISMPENMYVNDLQRAAFQAASKMADLMGDAQARDAYAARSVLMAGKLEERWNPKGFYGAAPSQPDNPMSTALLGEHSDDLLNLPRQLDPERVRRHLQYLGTSGHNFTGQTFQVMEHETVPAGAVTATIMSNSEGLRDYCSLALWRGCTREGMMVAKCFHDVVYGHLKREWNQPMLITTDRNPVFGNHYQSVPAAWHLLLGLEGLSWDVPNKTLRIRPNLPESFQGRLRAFLPGAVTWGRLDYSCVEPDCDQKFILNFERPFTLEFLGVHNSGNPAVSSTQGGETVPCSIQTVDASEYEVKFTPPLVLDKMPVEIRIGKK